MNARPPIEYVVGMALVLPYVPRGSSKVAFHHVTVVKVGRKYATLSGDHGRVPIDSRQLDGFGRGAVFLNEADFYEMKRAEELWVRVRRLIPHNTPPLHIVRQVAALLDIEIPEES